MGFLRSTCFFANLVVTVVFFKGNTQKSRGNPWSFAAPPGQVDVAAELRHSSVGEGVGESGWDGGSCRVFFEVFCK